MSSLISVLTLAAMFLVTPRLRFLHADRGKLQMKIITQKFIFKNYI
jgi:hypothetical protein